MLARLERLPGVAGLERFFKLKTPELTAPIDAVAKPTDVPVTRSWQDIRKECRNAAETGGRLVGNIQKLGGYDEAVWDECGRVTGLKRFRVKIEGSGKESLPSLFDASYFSYNGLHRPISYKNVRFLKNGQSFVMADKEYTYSKPYSKSGGRIKEYNLLRNREESVIR